jgi:hypothetical protein
MKRKKVQVFYLSVKSSFSSMQTFFFSSFLLTERKDVIIEDASANAAENKN